MPKKKSYNNENRKRQPNGEKAVKATEKMNRRSTAQSVVAHIQFFELVVNYIKL